MKLNSFFTKQRFIILGVGAIAFVVFLVLAHVFGHDTEIGVLFIDLAGSAVTIIATALIIELLQFIEKSNKTHEVAAIAEAEIQAVCYRIKLATVSLYGFEEDLDERDSISDLKDAGKYLDKTNKGIDSYYKNLDKNQRHLTMKAVMNFRTKSADLQKEIEPIISLFDYALPLSLRARVLSLRTILQVSERMLGYIDESKSLSKNNSSLINDVAHSVYESAQSVLEHGSRTESDKQLNTKPGRVGNI